jgi:hypothetical protein
MPLVQTPFSSFIYSDILDISDDLNETLKTEIQQIIKPGTLTNYHEDTSSVLKNPVFSPFFTIITEHIKMFTETIGYKQKLKIKEAWVTTSHPGTCHNLHTHGHNTVIAGVYYVEASEDLSLIFVNNTSRLTPSEHIEKLMTKKLLLFDGSLTHGFVPVTGTCPKITVAFNLWNEDKN